MSKGIEWFVEGILPARQVNVLSGMSGSGKTALAATLLQQLQSGEEFLWKFPICRRPSRICLVVADRQPEDAQLWYDLHKGLKYEMSTPFTSKTIKGATIRSAGFQLFDWCVAEFGELPSDFILLLDPMSLFLGPNLNDYRLVYSYMFDLNRFCIERKGSILGLLHSGKPKAKDLYLRPQDRVIGSTAQTACAGTHFHLTAREEEQIDCDTHNRPHTQNQQTVHWAPHHVEGGYQHLTRDKEGRFIPLEFAGSGPVSTDNWLKVKSAMQAGAKTVREISAMTGIPTTTVYRVRTMLKEKGEH